MFGYTKGNLVLPINNIRYNENLIIFKNKNTGWFFYCYLTLIDSNYKITKSAYR